MILQRHAALSAQVWWSSCAGHSAPNAAPLVRGYLLASVFHHGARNRPGRERFAHAARPGDVEHERPFSQPDILQQRSADCFLRRRWRSAGRAGSRACRGVRRGPHQRAGLPSYLPERLLQVRDRVPPQRAVRRARVRRIPQVLHALRVEPQPLGRRDAVGRQAGAARRRWLHRRQGVQRSSPGPEGPPAHRLRAPAAILRQHALFPPLRTL